MNKNFQDIFKPECPTNRDDSKFLSRVFGIFSEKIVSIWASEERAPYEDLGRPTIKENEYDRGHTLDFTLKDRVSGKVFVSEMKCEIEYNNFKFFVLERISQLDHHINNKPAFEAFLRTARPTVDQKVYVKKEKVDFDGAILIWGAVTSQGRNNVIDARNLHAVLSVEEICADLTAWKSVRYLELIEQRKKWCNRLFNGLL